MVKIIRVFPSKTRATPMDDDVRMTGPGLFDEADEIHVSVTFSWDIPRAEKLAKEWEHVAPVKIGGPAVGTRGAEFVPGMYLRPGYIITSRGCPNHCWFCSVWKRDGDVRELPIREGWNVLDDNLLACSENHILKVFEMLSRQKHRPLFTGGLEAKRLKLWHAKALRSLRPRRIYFAYDTPDDLEPLQEAGRLLRMVGFTTASHVLCCYVLCGWKGDTFKAAESRLYQTLEAGFTPMAMLYRNRDGGRDPAWRRFAREWARPAIIYSKQEQG